MDDRKDEDNKNLNTSPVDVASGYDVVHTGSDETQLQESIPTANTENIEVETVKLQEATDFSSEAYEKFLMTTLKEFSTIAASDEIGPEETILQVFRRLPSTGVRAELSIYNADVPVAPDVLVSMMLDVNSWAFSLSHIVRRAYSDSPPKTLQQLNTGDTLITNNLMVDAEFQIPFAAIKTRSFRFLRLLKEINADTWVIFDISNDYFLRKSDFSLGKNSCKRQSGVVVRRLNKYSKVIWVENLELPDSDLQRSVNIGKINSEVGFCAKRWVTTLIWWLKRMNSTFAIDMINVNGGAHNLLLKLSDSMKMRFLDIVSATRDDKKWFNLPGRKLRVWASMVDNSWGMKKYAGISTFKLNGTPSEVFDFLVRKNVELQWPICPQSFRGHKEVINCVSEDGSNCITLLKRDIYESAISPQPTDSEFLLQEALEDGFCSIIISAPMTQRVCTTVLFGSERDLMLEPAGFVMVPDGLNSNASLITILVQQQLLTSDTDEVKISMRNLLYCMISDLRNEFLEELEYRGDDRVMNSYAGWPA